MKYLKLFVKRSESNSKELTIYDGNGIELPLIQKISIESPVGELPIMTVTFVLANDSIVVDSGINNKQE